MKIAIASSGLGHVARGIETWALDTAAALVREGADATLFCGAALPSAERYVRALPCLRRADTMARILARCAPGLCWRWGLKNPYGWEQLFFWRKLRHELCRGGYDILHVQDPMLAYWCARARKAGVLKTREILAHGTEEPLAFLSRFDYVQHLVPWHLEQAVSELGRTVPTWTAIPNFVDTEIFHPVSAEEKRVLRKKFGLPENAVIAGCVAAIKKYHKRIDYLLQETASLSGRPDLYVVVAGARQEETDELLEYARQTVPDTCRLMVDVSRADMPDLYRCFDVFVLTSLFEMMPIAVLEALASGLPVIANRHPVLEWMTGDGGTCIDMSEPAALSRFLQGMTPEWIVSKGQAARHRAESVFVREAVIRKYLDYYKFVMTT